MCTIDIGMTYVLLNIYFGGEKLIKVKNKEKLNELINKHNLSSIFSNELTPHLELHIF